jgi:hypothetical protein
MRALPSLLETADEVLDPGVRKDLIEQAAHRTLPVGPDR